MNTRIVIGVIATTLLSGFLGLALADAEKSTPKAQTVCPMMGGRINRELFADYNGWRVYFCCPNCVGSFKKDAAKYIEKLQKAGIQLEQTPQTVCPVSGNELANKDISVEYDGRTIYFCCPACPEAFQKDPAKYFAKLGISVEKKEEEAGEAHQPEGHEGHEH